MAVKRIWSSHFGHMIPSFLATDSGNLCGTMIVNEFAMEKFRLTTSTSSFRAADSVQIATEHSVLLVTGRTEWLAVCILSCVVCSHSLSSLVTSVCLVTWIGSCVFVGNCWCDIFTGRMNALSANDIYSHILRKSNSLTSLL